MEILRSTILTEARKIAILDIWNRAYPKTLNYPDLASFKTELRKYVNATHYIAILAGEIAGWAVTFDRNETTWFVILIDSRHQGKGIGSMVMDALKKDVTELRGWVIETGNYFRRDGRPYKSPMEFYRKMDFEITDQRIKNEKIAAVEVRWNKTAYPQSQGLDILP